MTRDVSAWGSARLLLTLVRSPGPSPAQVEDNFLDVAPPVIFFVALVQFVKWKRVQMLREHRD